MANFVTVPLKKTSEVNLAKPLKNAIPANYSTAENPVSCEDAVDQLDKLRNNAVCRPLDKHENSLDIINRYYDQLNALENKIVSRDIQIPFKWRDAFDKGSFFYSKLTLTIPSLAYEKVCVLFNIGALLSQIAGCQELESDDGLKTAAKYFQMAAGIFQHLKNTVISSIQQEPTPDIHPDTLSALQALMLAQAQETLFQKASADRMKDAVVAKVAMQCEDLYADAIKQMKRESLKPMWEKEHIPMLTGKQLCFHATAEYHQSLVAKANKSIGEELSRLERALSFINEANAKARGICDFNDMGGRIKRAYDEAKKDNDFIYHEKIPDYKSFPTIGKAIIVKATPLPEKLSSKFTDLFDALVPVNVQQSLELYDVRKSELVNSEVGKLREETQMMNSILASMNLPAALEDSSGNELPPSITEKCETVQQKGGVGAINKILTDMPELLQRNSDILKEVESLLKDEEQSDDQLRSQFQEKWKRTRSSELNESLKTDCSKYRQLLNNAINADNIVREKFNKHKQWIEALSGPTGNLKSLIPASNPTANLSNNPKAQKLKSLMEQVESIKAERDVIESEIKSATTDMKDKFLQALKDEGSINEEAMSVEVLGRIYGPLQKQVRETVEQQQALMNEVQQANTEFCQIKSQNQTAAQRETALRDIAAAYDAFNELLSNLVEGTKFYNDLTQILVNFQNKVNDFCFARKTEKEELCKDVQQQIVRQPSQTSPPVPAHHGISAAVPERPPPPTFKPAEPTVSKPTPAPRSNPPVPAMAASNPTAPGGQPQTIPPYPAGNQPSANTPYSAGNQPTPYSAYPYPYQPATQMPSGYNPYNQPYPAQPTQYGVQQQGQYPPANPYQNYGQQPTQQYNYGQQYPPAPGTYPPAPGTYPPPNYPGGQW
ncbi:Programmed cell death 6-interacting protein [Nymphon striatum]|nr:Programmed cell death 6-interacting protein [Nymphon striatum]KAG1688013.1 Programmed cell death 6-interacting protein [Nymphon striatum]